MDSFQLLASPWWVNLLVVLPFVVYFAFRRRGLSVPTSILVAAAIFGIAFGYNEAVGVVYLRDILGILPNSVDYGQIQLLHALPSSITTIEFFREIATLVMLLAIAFVSARAICERVAVFVWTFAFWDLFYYAGLWAVIRWPTSLLSPDVLFLIPVPWLSQVWFPILVSALTIAAVLMVNRRK